MMKNIKKTLLFTLLFSMILLLNNVKAATASISANKTSINVGDSVTVTVSTTAGAWNLSINGGGLTTSDSSGLVGQTSTTSNSSASKTYTFTATKAGTYTVSLSGDITDYDTDQKSKISKSVTITATEKSTTQNNTTTNTTNTTNTTTNTTNTTKNNTTNTTTNTTTQTPAPTFQSTNDTVYATVNGVNVRDSWSTSGKVVGSLNKGDSVTRTGIGSNGWDRVLLNGTIAYVNRGYITTEKPAEEVQTSTNKALQKLEIEGYTLDPTFDPETTRYTITLNEDDDELKINAVAADEEKAKVNIEGNGNFSTGNNIVKITVTAEDGTTRIYTITVIKEGETAQVDDLKLSSLKVTNATLEPTFDKDVKTYVIEVDDPSSIKAEDITAVAEDDDVEVTVAIKDASEDGEKVITILLESKDEDDERTGVYQINVKKPTVLEETFTRASTDKTIYYIFGGIIAVLIILIIIVAIILKKTSDDDYDDDEDYDEDNENYEDNNGNQNNSNYNQSLKDAIDEANGLYDYDADQDITPKSQILSNKIPNRNTSMDETQMFDSEKFKEVSERNSDLSSRRRGKHF